VGVYPLGPQVRPARPILQQSHARGTALPHTCPATDAALKFPHGDDCTMGAPDVRSVLRPPARRKPYASRRLLSSLVRSDCAVGYVTVRLGAPKWILPVSPQVAASDFRVGAYGFLAPYSHCSFLTCHGALRKVCPDRIIVGWRRPEGAVPFVMEATEHGAGSQLEGLLMANGDDEFGAGRRVATRAPGDG
jgi:hypothetical protein